MKKLFTLLILVFLLNLLYGQNPSVKQWDYRFGGTNEEAFVNFGQTSDGGYILAGYTSSDSSGDKTQPSWGQLDFWILKTDSLGNKMWDKRFGAATNDELRAFVQTADGGYIFGGGSNSGMNGDKSQPSWGGEDFWVVKTDSAGNKEWDKRYGSIDEDFLYSLQQTDDGGYILGGYSDGGISGDKTQPGWGQEDFWVVKIDGLGNKQWDKRFGGSSFDEIRSLSQTSDGGYILGGFSFSGVSGDKTQPSWGDYDYWIVKINSLGIKQWDKRFGGTLDDEFTVLLPADDGGYILGGLSTSDSSGDKSHPNWDVSLNTYDYWIIKIDSLGSKQWDKAFGGIANEELSHISKTSDNGYLFSGDSYSSISGDKSEVNLGIEQNWVVKTDSLGNKQWDKTIFTTGHDESGDAIQTTDGCYVMAINTSAGPGGYKTQPSWNGSVDYWFVKFCDSTSTTGINNSNFDFQISVYPNPFTSSFSITIQKQNFKQVSFIMKNILGQTIFRKNENNLSNTYTKTIDLSLLSKGVYLLDVIIDGERTVKKIIKE